MNDANALAVNDDLRPAAPERFLGEPPESVKAKARGFPPQRARLARFLAWQRQTADDLAEANATRSRLIDSLGVPAVTERSIADLVKTDIAALIGWAKSGKASRSPEDLGRDLVRSIERDRMEDQLSGDRHKLEVAKAALAEAEVDIAALEAGVATLAARRGEFLRDALVEEVDRLGEQYLRSLFDAREKLRLMLAATAAANVQVTAQSFVAPRFDTPLFAYTGNRRGIEIAFGKVEMQKHAALWSVLASEWGSDPSVDPAAIFAVPIPPDDFAPSGEETIAIYLPPDAARTGARTMTVAPAADLPEQDPLPEWLDALDGSPLSIPVTFVDGRAEVPAALARYMLKRGYACAAPAVMEA